MKLFGPSECAQCGRSIEGKAEKSRGKKFCSIRCRDIWEREEDLRSRT